MQTLHKIPLGSGVVGKASKTGRVIITNNLPEEDVYKSIAEEEKLQFMASVPLKCKGRTQGVISIFSNSARYPAAQDRALLETIGNEVGVAVENSRLLERLDRLSITDELTGLYNRRHFYEVLEAEIYRVQRYGRPFSLAMLDLDGFKEYNDRLGHTNGDAVLQAFAEMVRRALRKTDVAFRYGGDEFAIMLSETGADRAGKIVDRIRVKWSQMPKTEIPIRESLLGFSAGIAQFPEDAETADGLIFLADTALYHSKRQEGYMSTLVSDMGALSPSVLGTAAQDQVYALAATVDARDPYTYGHSKRVAAVSETIGKAIKLSRNDLGDLCAASLLHDIGKVGVPDSILTKPGRPTEKEWDLIRRHSVEGAKIVVHVKELAGLVAMITHHHEWYDGTGYPDSLKGEEIPLGARIISVADAYDTMTTARPYREVVSQEEAQTPTY